MKLPRCTLHLKGLVFPFSCSTIKRQAERIDRGARHKARQPIFQLPPSLMQLTSRRPRLRRGNFSKLVYFGKSCELESLSILEPLTTALGTCSHCRQRQCKSWNKINAINKTADRPFHRKETWPHLPPILSVWAISTSRRPWFKINGLVHKVIHSHLHQLIQKRAFQFSLRFWDNGTIWKFLHSPLTCCSLFRDHQYQMNFPAAKKSSRSSTFEESPGQDGARTAQCDFTQAWILFKCLLQHLTAGTSAVNRTEKAD